RQQNWFIPTPQPTLFRLHPKDSETINSSFFYQLRRHRKSPCSGLSFITIRKISEKRPIKIQTCQARSFRNTRADSKEAERAYSGFQMLTTSVANSVSFWSAAATGRRFLFATGNTGSLGWSHAKAKAAPSRRTPKASSS
ncbi:MAG TPA: hypothetical protein PK012_26455, partial [Blastocatellia bacterium]|nr:hypothetical protein [Blastocatellia bacterium]